MIRVMLVDDHAMLLEGVALALHQEPDIEVVGTATTLVSGFERFCSLEPDVLVVDYRIDEHSGSDLARKVIERDPSAAIVVMSALDSDRVLDDIVASGCIGFVEKRAGVDALATAVRAASRGSVHFPRRALSLRTGGLDPVDSLTSRELAILELLGRGMSSGEAAEHLSVSVHTVRNHTREIRRKLDVTTQLAAVVKAIRLGLIASPADA